VAYRVALQLAVFLLPFIMYGVYRLLISDAQADGRKTWPINSLFGAGAALTLGLWVYLASREDKDRDNCYQPAGMENGVLVPGKQIPCPEGRSVIDVGAPTTDEPGQAARGFGVRPRDDVSRAEEVPRSNDALPPLNAERPSEVDREGQVDVTVPPPGAGSGAGDSGEPSDSSGDDTR